MRRLLRLTLYFSYIALILVMAVATFVESANGTAFVHQHIYGAWWFTALWAVLGIVGIFILTPALSFKGEGALRSHLTVGNTNAQPTNTNFKTPSPLKGRAGVRMLHLSFLVILAGALLTHLTGRSGSVHLRMGERQTVAEIEHNGRKYYHRLNFAAELTGFKIVEDENGMPTDFCSQFKLTPQSGEDGQELTVSMNNIATYGSIRFYQASYDYDRRGVTLMINRDPYGIPVTYCGYFMLFLSCILILTPTLSFKGEGALRSHLTVGRDSAQSTKTNYKAPSPLKERAGVRMPGVRMCCASVFLLLAWCLYYFVLDGSWAQIPVLRHPLLIFHVVIIILAYALLLVQTLISLWSLCRPCRAGEVRGFSVLRLALCLLSIGIFLGAVWANISWGNYWSWDSKEVWALITLMVYAIPLHRRSLPAFRRPRVFHAYMLLAFLTVLMTYFGVNYLLTGMHSYR